MDDAAAVQHIAKLKERLDAMREKYSDRPFLYEMNSQSVLDDIRSLKSQIRDSLFDPESEYDVFIELNGPHFSRAGGLIGTVAAALDGFRIATQYAASTLTDSPSSTGRFSRRVSEAANFFLKAATPGSLRLGLEHGPVRRSLDTKDRDIEDVLSEVDDRRNLGLNAVRLLVRALRATTDDEAFSQLQDDIGSERTFLILRHVDRVLPDGVERLTFGGTELGVDGTADDATPSAVFERDAVLRGQELRLSDSPQASVAEPRAGIRMAERYMSAGQLPEAEISAEEYAEGKGVLSMLDLDNELVRFRTVQFGTRDEQLAMLHGRPVGSLSGLADLLNRPVRFAGMLSLDQAGVPREIKLDTVALAQGS